jgi:hypothetical protein
VPTSGDKDDDNNNDDDDDDDEHHLEEDHVIDDVDDTLAAGGPHTICAAVFVVGDSSVRDTQELPVCAPGRSRVRHLYTSIGHQVSLYMTVNVEDDLQHHQAAVDDESHSPAATLMPTFARFMINYEGNRRCS